MSWVIVTLGAVLHSLRFKFIMLTVALVVTLQLTSIATIYLTANSLVAEQTHARLNAASIAFDNALAARRQRLSDTAYALARDSTLVIGTLSADTAAIRLERAIQRLGTPVGAILSQTGEVIAATAELSPDAKALSEFAASHTELPASTTIRKIGDRTYEISALQLSETPVATWLTVALPIDATLAQTLRALTGTDVVLLSADLGAPQLLASSIDGLTATVDTLLSASPSDDTLQYGGIHYVTRTLASGSDAFPLQGVLLLDADAPFAPYQDLVMVVVSSGLLALLFGLMCTLMLYRRVMQPVDRFGAAARRIGAGDYTQPLLTGSSEKFNELVVAMNLMQANIAKREEQVTYQAQFDRLTGLPNRFLAAQRLQASIDKLDGTDIPISVMQIDLHNFGEIAASFGSEIGDVLLARAAERLRTVFDERHLLARLESNNFLVVMEGIKPTVARDSAVDVRHLLGAGLAVLDANITMDASIGICGFPENGNDTEQLLLHAAVAKNAARETPENINIYREGQEDRYIRQLAILGDLRRAVREDELKLYMQPKVDLTDGSVCGAEALVRWDHPTLGFLPPQDFIEIAERSGNMPLLTRWIVTTALRDCRLWREEGLDIPVSVNLTREDLADPYLPDFILQTLRENNLDPESLTLEIPECSLVDDPDKANAILQSLRKFGTRIAIDDFGTGHSSLAHIRNLSVDELKIDRSFIRKLPDSPQDIAIVRAAIDLAHDLGMQVVAEGVESKEAMHWLAEHGCENGQGFFISRPMPAETLTQWVSHFTGEVTAYVSVIDAIHG